MSATTVTIGTGDALGCPRPGGDADGAEHRQQNPVGTPAPAAHDRPHQHERGGQDTQADQVGGAVRAGQHLPNVGAPRSPSSAPAT